MTFADIGGHQPILSLVARAIARGTLPPSLLFVGPDGVGKFASAAALALTVNCEAPVRHSASSGLDVDACGRCPSCVRLSRALDVIARGDTPAVDCLRVLRPDERSTIRVDPTRQLLAACAYRPIDGRQRVAIIDDADALEVAAQNALLKMLEEPPSATVFVLVTSRPDSLVDTIRSRCPRLRFAPLRTGELADILIARGIPADDARAATSLAGGSVARALELAADDATGVRETAVALLEQLGRARGVFERFQAAQMLLARSERKGTRRKTATGTAATRADVAARLDALAGLLRDVHVVSSRADERWLVNADLATVLAGLTRTFDGQRIRRAFAAVERARDALERNVSPKTLADWLAFQV